MIRDVKERLLEFGVIVNVIPIALTIKQINEFSPPSNPAKLTDTRATWYIEQYGKVSWEIDALNPKTLHEVLQSNILILLDISTFNKVLENERDDIQKLKEFIK
jgi:hypothetical protein